MVTMPPHCFEIPPGALFANYRGVQLLENGRECGNAASNLYTIASSVYTVFKLQITLCL